MKKLVNINVVEIKFTSTLFRVVAVTSSDSFSVASIIFWLVQHWVIPLAHDSWKDSF